MTAPGWIFIAVAGAAVLFFVVNWLAFSWGHRLDALHRVYDPMPDKGPGGGPPDSGAGDSPE